MNSIKTADFFMFYELPIVLAEACAGSKMTKARKSKTA